jgi:hypothetical protein
VEKTRKQAAPLRESVVIFCSKRVGSHEDSK